MSGYMVLPNSTTLMFSVTDIVWMGPRGEESFYDLITSDENIQDMMSQLQTVVQGKWSTLKSSF